MSLLKALNAEVMTSSARKERAHFRMHGFDVQVHWAYSMTAIAAACVLGSSPTRAQKPKQPNVDGRFVQPLGTLAPTGQPEQLRIDSNHLSWFLLWSLGDRGGRVKRDVLSTYVLTAIAGGHWLAVLLVMGAVIGAFGA